MATKYWLGTADSVAQVTTVQITAYDAATTYTLTVGGVAISAAGNTDVNQTATDLAAAWNASTHPYASAVTASASTDTVTLTADTAGVPFTVTSSVAAGTGTIGSATAATASAGPNDWSTAANWSDGSIPGNTDTVIFRNSSVSVRWGLDQSSVTIDNLYIEKSYTGKIGNNRLVFATSADAATTDSSKREYRDCYLKIDYDVAEIGKYIGKTSPAGSSMIYLNNQNTGTSVTTVFDTASASLAAVQLLTASASADLYIRDGSVGVAVGAPAETSTVGDIYIDGKNARCYTGSGVTLTSVTQSAGESVIQAAATITAVLNLGGTITLEGAYTVTTLTIAGGVCYSNNSPTSGNAVTTANLNGGSTVTTQSSAARTWATTNLGKGASLRANANVLTLTALNDPANDYTLSVA